MKPIEININWAITNLIELKEIIDLVEELQKQPKYNCNYILHITKPA